MPTIEPFRGLRYDLAHVGSLSDVIAPPYDVIDDQLQDELYQRHPANVIRLELNRDEPGDDPEAKYQRAARFLQNWRDEGVLRLDDQPAVYVYHQVFDYRGETFTRRGFMCRTRLERFGEGRIYPHEETHASAKADRLMLTRACRTNLSQIFGLYPDAENVAQNLLEGATAGQAPLEAVDHLGVIHRMWVVTDPQVLAAVQQVMEAKPTFIADGHHRYETACNYRDELMSQGPLDPYHPANYVLMMCVSMNDPGLLVLPTHRLFRGVDGMTAEQLRAKLGPAFDTRLAGEGPDLAQMLWAELEKEQNQGALALFTEADQRWTVARITSAGREKMAQIATDHSSDWQGLGVAILHRLVMENLLGYRQLPKPNYVHLVDEVVQGLHESPEEYSLAALVMPATVDHIRAISEHGERMPAKSTYFYPKLLSGLVFHPLQ
ncbi:MAG: DUF1015 domain-containing protein [Pirellulales bacterium]